MYFVLIETAGNQKYIFSTNKLKENIGASELTYQASTKWLLEAIGNISNNQPLTVWQDSQRLRQTLLSPEKNPPIEASEQNHIEVIVAASGKALVLTRTEEQATRLIQAVTHKALIEAPGLEVLGVYLPFEWERDALGEKNRELHQRYEAVRATRPSADLRFLRVPIAADCQNSSLPAAMLRANPDGGSPQTLSQMSVAKQSASDGGKERVEKLLKKSLPNCGFAGDTNDLEKIKDLDWLAIVHADGNGLGQIFLNFHEHIEATTAADNRDYINQLRQFSIGLDICTEKAFLSALDQLPASPTTDPDKQLIPLTPLILGGDDLTVVCDGRSALPFITKFLAAFEQETAVSHEGVGNIVAEVAQAALGVNRLSACAGISIVKLHFPFSVAYELASALIKSAKRKISTMITNPVNDKPYPCSALDFHIVYDASDVSFDRIRSKLTTSTSEKSEEKGTEAPPALLYKRPYVVTPMEKLAETTGVAWAAFHNWQNLLSQVKVLTAIDEEGRKVLPNSQVHDLRVALYQGKAVADARYRLIRDRYPKQGLTTLAGDDLSLFQSEPGTNIPMTALIDALDASEFMRRPQTDQPTATESAVLA